MMEPLAVSLPALTVSKDSVVRYKGVPRRYDETRPVLIQAYAHRKILGIGHDLHKKVIEKEEEQKLQAIRKAEQAVWAEAEQIKAIALQKARDEAAIEQEKALKKLQKSHEKALKEEALRVEMAMQKLAIEQVKQERAEGEARLKEAVRKTEEKGHNELIVAVEKARHEERKVAADEAAKIAKINKDKFDAAIKAAAEEKHKLLKILEEKKDRERKVAVDDMEQIQKKMAAEQLRQLKSEYITINEKLKEEIRAKLDVIDKLELQITFIENAKANVEQVLVDTKKSYQDFIDRVKLYDKGQTDFLLRPVYIDEIGRVNTIM